MLSTNQKATILGKAGFAVPVAPGEPETHPASQSWVRAVETLYVTYAAARAAKSLREAEEARQLTMLRQLSLKSYA